MMENCRTERSMFYQSFKLNFFINSVIHVSNKNTYVKMLGIIFRIKKLTQIYNKFKNLILKFWCFKIIPNIFPCSLRSM